MGETFEKLGLEVVVDADKVAAGLAKVGEILNKTFKLDGIQKLVEQMQKLDSGAGASQKNLERITERIKKIGEAAGLSEAQVKKYIKTFADDKALEKFFTDLRKSEGEMVAHVKAFQKMQQDKVRAQENAGQQILAIERNTAKFAAASLSEQLKSGQAILAVKKNTDTFYSQQGAQILAIQRNTEAANKAVIRSYEEKAQQILAIERRTQQALKQQLDAQISQGSATLASYKNSGFQPVNGGYVKSSVNVNQGMDEAHASALKMNQTYSQLLPQIREYEQYMQALKTRGQAMWNGQIVSTQQYSRNLREMNGEVKNTAGAFDFLGATFGRMAARLTEFYGIRNILFAVGNQFRTAVGGALDLNQAVHDIAAISGAPREAMQGISNSILDIATHSRYSAKEVAGLMEVLAQAGVAAKDLPITSSTVGMFATGAGATPEQAADVFTTALNVFDIKAEQGARVANVLTAALNNSKLSVGGLATAFNYLGPQAAQLGISLEDVAGIIATMSQAGIKASTIGTGVSQLLKELTVPKARFKNLLDQYGINPEEVNPKLHSFADIVDKLKSKGVQTEHLFQALETRVGRSVVAAVNLGGDAFRTMTTSVTGTNAAIVSYDKAMEGSRARINVLKQEFLSLFVGIGTQTSSVFGGMLDAVTKVTKGLQKIPTLLVEIVAGIGLLALALKGLSLLTVTGAVITAVTAVGTALAWAFGHDFDGQTQSVKRMSKNLSEQAEKTQAVKDVTEKAKIEAEGNNKELKEYDRLLKAGKGNTAEAIALGNKQVKISSESKKAMYELREAHGEYFKTIDIEKMKYTDLLAVLKKVNDERFGSNESATAEYNSIVQSRNEEKALLNIEKQRLKSRGDTQEYGGNIALERSIAEREKKIAKSESNLKELRSKITGKVASSDGILVNLPDALTPEKEAVLPLGKPDNGKTEEKAEDIVRKLSEKHKATVEQLKLEKLKIDREALEAELTDKELQGQEFFDKQVQADEKLEEEYKQKAIQRRTKKYEELALALKGKFENNKILYGKGFKQKDVEALINNAEEELGLQNSADKSAFGKEESKIFKAVPKAVKLPKDTSMKDEKGEVNRLRDELFALNLRKEQVKTGEELRNVELQIVAAQEKSAENILDIYTKRQAALEKRRAEGKFDADDKDGSRLDEEIEAAKGRVDELTFKIRELKAELARKEDGDFFSNFSQGMYRSITAMGDFKSNTQALGEQVTSTFTGGIENSINGMIDALGRGGNAWQSFRQTMGKMLQDISQMLQQFIVKMLVVYAVEQMIGLVMSGSGKAIDSQTGAILPSQPAGSTVGGITRVNSGGFIRGDGSVLRFLGGGMVPLDMGVPGKDSVRALLTPGEIVINEKAVNKYGARYFLDHNAQKFAEGGLVGASDNYKGKGSSKESGEFSLIINNFIDPARIPKGTGAAEILNTIQLDTLQNGPTYRLIKARLQGNA